MDKNRFRAQAGPPRRGGSLVMKAVYAIVALIIIYFIVTWAWNTFSVVGISGPTNLTITNSSTIFTLQGGEYSTSLVSYSPSATQISLTRQPTFLNPTFYVTLYNGSSTKVNGAGQYANIQIALDSASNSAAQVTITPIAASALATPDSSRITVASTSLTPFGGAGGVQPQSTTTVTQSQSTTTVTQSQSTTTVAQSSTTTIAGTGYYNTAVAILHQNEFYGLMLNYTALYASDTGCSPAIYNQSYDTKYGSYPTGPTDYHNLSTHTPTAMTLNITNTTTSAVATYIAAVANQSFSGPAIVIKMNLQSKLITGTVVEGVYQDLNYSSLLNGYTYATSHEPCGVYGV
jgi:hypothetical protein